MSVGQLKFCGECRGDQVGVAPGQLRHSDIGRLPPVSYGMALAAPVHYAIGAALAVVFHLASAFLGLPSRNPITAIGFALCTKRSSMAVHVSAMGYGWFRAQGPTGTRLFLSSFVTDYGNKFGPR